MKRPSQFMLAFLVVAGSALMIGGEDLEPTKPVILGKEPSDAPKIVSRGVANDSTDTTSSFEKLRGPWKLHGKILGEVAGSEDLALMVGLELVPIGEGRHANQTLLSTVSNAEGSYRWEGLLPGQYRIRALPRQEDAEHLAISMDFMLPETSADSVSHEQDLLLPYPRTMRGNVRSADNAQDAEGARVTVSETGMHRGTAIVDANGSFTIERVGPGPWDFLVREKSGKQVDASIRTLPESGDPSTIQVAIVTP